MLTKRLCVLLSAYVFSFFALKTLLIAVQINIVYVYLCSITSKIFYGYYAVRALPFRLANVESQVPRPFFSSRMKRQA